MTVIHAKKITQISQAKDRKKAIIDGVGEVLSGIEVMHNHILVGIYIRDEKTKHGIILPTETLREDQFQGKVGVVLKKGPLAFKDDGANDFGGQDVDIGDWIVFRVSDGWQLTINDTPCRMLEDTLIRMKIARPDIVF